jgi:integral membrane protein
VPVDPAGELTGTPKSLSDNGVSDNGVSDQGLSDKLPGPAPTAGRPAATTAAVPPKIMAAFRRYRIAAFVVGWGLLILCAAMVAKYVFDAPSAVAVWGPIHGALFVVYVIIAFDLAYKDRWSPLGTVWVLVAGTIPFVSFVAERQVQRKVLARQKM